jgi:tetratricopeptide (TPR) repeat protein
MDELEQQYGFESVLVDYPDVPEKEVLLDERFGKALSHPGWALVYWDDRSLLYLKRGGRYDIIIERSEYRSISPEPHAGRAVLRDARRRELAAQDLLRNIRETGSARAHKLLGDCYQEMGRYREALEEYRRALEHPLGDRFAAYSGIASSLRGLGRPDEALPYLQKALSLREDPALVANLGLYHLAKGERKEALAQLEKALRLNPDLTSLYPLLIGLYSELGMQDKATRVRELQAKATRASEGEVHFRNGIQAYIRKDYDAALREFAGSIAVNPGNPAPYSNIGYVYYDKGMLDEAFAYQRKALDIDPALANAHYGLALIHTRSGDRLAAKRHWEEYLRLEPSGYYSRRAREELRSLP